MASIAAARPGRLATRRWVPYACVLAAATMWGTIGVSYRVLLDHIATDEVTIVTIRASSAAVLLGGWLAARDRGAFRVRRGDVPFLAGFALVTVTVFYLALIYALDRTSVAVGTVLLYLAPAFVTLGAALFLHERLTHRKLAALASTFGGCLLVVQAYRPANLEGNALGVGLALLSAVTYASYSLMGKRLLSRYRAVTVLAYDLLIGSAGLILVKVIVSPTAWPSWLGLLAIAGYSGIVTTLAPITLYTIGLRGLPSSEASILATFEPVVAVMLAAAILGETLSVGQAFGALGVIGGVVLLAARGAVRPSTIGAQSPPRTV